MIRKKLEQKNNETTQRAVREFSGEAKGQCLVEGHHQELGKKTTGDIHMYLKCLDLKNGYPNEVLKVLRYQNCQNSMPRGGRAISKHLCFEATQRIPALAPPFPSAG